jgi:hypothetical protein
MYVEINKQRRPIAMQLVFQQINIKRNINLHFLYFTHS